MKVFAGTIEPGASLFGVMIWDPTVEKETMLSDAMSLYYLNAGQVR